MKIGSCILIFKSKHIFTTLSSASRTFLFYHPWISKNRIQREKEEEREADGEKDSRWREKEWGTHSLASLLEIEFERCTNYISYKTSIHTQMSHLRGHQNKIRACMWVFIRVCMWVFVHMYVRNYVIFIYCFMCFSCSTAAVLKLHI